jgi:hypothetical protein
MHPWTLRDHDAIMALLPGARQDARMMKITLFVAKTRASARRGHFFTRIR